MPRSDAGLWTSWRSSSTSTTGPASCPSVESNRATYSSSASAGARRSAGGPSAARESAVVTSDQSRCGSLQSGPSATHATWTGRPRTASTQAVTSWVLPDPGPPQTSVTA
jgi:hypothetical protein